MPLLSKYVNILTTEALQQALFIDPLQKRLLDVASLQCFSNMPTKLPRQLAKWWHKGGNGEVDVAKQIFAKRLLSKFLIFCRTGGSLYLETFSQCRPLSVE